MINLLNIVCPFLGLFLCLIAWRIERMNTKPFAIQATMILFILMWLSLYLVDVMQHDEPTVYTVVARYLALSACLTINCYIYIVTGYIRKLKKEIDHE